MAQPLTLEQAVEQHRQAHSKSYLAFLEMDDCWGELLEALPSNSREQRLKFLVVFQQIVQNTAQSPGAFNSGRLGNGRNAGRRSWWSLQTKDQVAKKKTQRP